MNQLPLNQIVDQCASTNKVLSGQVRAGLEDGAWLAARVQSAGKGRTGRSWESLEGNCHLSIHLKETKPDLLIWYPIWMAVVLADLLNKEILEDRIKIKWPNDLYFEGAKLGGILCESFKNGDYFSIVVGIGVNLNEAPKIPQINTTCIREISGKSSDLATFIKNIIGICNISQYGDRINPQELRNRFTELSYFQVGDEIQWDDGDNSIQGKLLEYNKECGIKVALADGEIKILYSGDVKKVRTI